VRIAYLIVRYGTEILGGAEQGCRMLAERLVGQAGWEVEVFTTCAFDSGTWADHYPPGTTTINGVTVHRFAAQRGRDPGFDDFSSRVLRDPERTTVDDQQRWMTLQGPVCPAAVEAATACRADVVVVSPYLYWPTVAAVARLGRRTVMHPAAHDEPPIRLPLFAAAFSGVGGLVFYTDGERRLVQRLFPAVAAIPQLVLGLGVEIGGGEPDRFRADYGLGDDPYLLCLGRVDDGKGALLLAEFFAAYKRRRPGPLQLVFAGPVTNRPAEHADVVVTGPLDETAKWGALRGATLLVSPSPNESFSLVVLEAWAAGVAVVVHGRCPATAEHTRRSGGGMAFTGYASFEAILDRLLADAKLRARLSAAGARYVEANFSWPVLVPRYARFLERTARTAAASE
jgi:glycosyltransferase involved in cell wall biosynthesis